jgi:hypothetical protein
MTAAIRSRRYARARAGFGMERAAARRLSARLHDIARKVCAGLISLERAVELADAETLAAIGGAA